MKKMGGHIKRVQCGFFNNNAKRSNYPVFNPLDDSVKHKRCRVEDMVDIEEGEKVALIITAVDGAHHYRDLMKAVNNNSRKVSFCYFE